MIVYDTYVSLGRQVSRWCIHYDGDSPGMRSTVLLQGGASCEYVRGGASADGMRRVQAEQGELGLEYGVGAPGFHPVWLPSRLRRYCAECSEKWNVLAPTPTTDEVLIITEYILYSTVTRLLSHPWKCARKPSLRSSCGRSGQRG